METETHIDTATQPAPAASATSPKKPQTLSKVLPSDRLAFDKQVSALRAFVAANEGNGGKPVTNDEAGEISIPKMAGGTIVVTNAFFCDVGLLSRVDGGFVVSPEASAFLHVENSGISPETAPEKLRPLFEKQWFSQCLLPRLRLGAQDIGSIHKVLGEASNATKDHLPRLDLIIEFLVFVGIVAREGNQIRLKGGAPRQENLNEKPTVKTDQPSDNAPEGLERYTLTLDPKSKKRVVIFAPPTITATELKRLQAWLGLQLIVEGDSE